ncbi:MAG: YgfZ/GcvT domain-containing protein [Phycisphaerales bacterium]
MARLSPIQPLHDQAGAMMLPYGPDETPAAADSKSSPEPSAPINIVGTYGELELEYASIRKGCLLLDLPQRALLEVTGADRLEFLNRMVTQELKPAKKWLDPYQSVSSFWLNRKGRIDADLRIIVLADRVLLECDAHASKRALDGLNAFIITEDAAIRDLSATTHRLALHGPTAIKLIDAISTPVSGPAITSLAANQATIVRVADAEVIIDRRDQTGELGLDLFVPTEHARALYELLLERGFPHEHVHERVHSTELSAEVRLRPGGWHAFNIARIEGGTPLYYIDFGPSSLPAETGVVNDRVSFTKGCYLGQEVVARMHSRGHSKRQLVALLADPMAPRPPADPTDLDDPYLAGMPQPVSGAQVLPLDASASESLGVITSSTLSPMNAATAICFAAVKHDAAVPNTKFRVPAESELLVMTSQPSLRTLPNRS